MDMYSMTKAITQMAGDILRLHLQILVSLQESLLSINLIPSMILGIKLLYSVITERVLMERISM